MPSSWTEINDNFRGVMEVSMSGYRYAEVIDIEKRSGVPASAWDKAYTVQMNGMPETVNYYSGVLDINYNTRLQVAYELNEHDGNASYGAAVADLEAIIIKRLDTRTWQTSDIFTILNIKHITTSPFIFTSPSTSDEHYGVVNIDFLVTGRQVIT